MTGLRRHRWVDSERFPIGPQIHHRGRPFSTATSTLPRNLFASRPRPWRAGSWPAGLEQLPGVAFAGPVGADETCIGREETTKHPSKQVQFAWGPVDKRSVPRATDRASNQVTARVIERSGRETVRGFGDRQAGPDATVYTDRATTYNGRERHEAVHHSTGESVWERPTGQVWSGSAPSSDAATSPSTSACPGRASGVTLGSSIGHNNLRHRDTIDGMQANLVGYGRQEPTTGSNHVT